MIPAFRPLGAQRPVAELAAGLRKTDRVRSRANGNRTTRGDELLRHLEEVAGRVGISRVADLSFLSPTGYPVFQTCRPDVMFHTRLGFNSGSQGKGPNPTQAKISSLMEAIEGYCSEPRSPRLVRASYAFLRTHKVVANPADLVHQLDPDPLTADTPLMWTEAHCLELDAPVLVPAEAAYYPFFPRTYETPSVFVSSTNGLASGATYLEAVIHAIYEVIERHYECLFERGEVRVEALYEQELDDPRIDRFVALEGGELELQLYAVELPSLRRNLPTVLCLIAGEGIQFAGWGCSGTLALTLDRAISEAFQSKATQISGAREDMEDEIQRPETMFVRTPQPARRTLRLRDYRKRVFDRTFATLGEELAFVKKVLKQLGCHRTYVVNLTRYGVDLPVVKVICEGLAMDDAFRDYAKVDPRDLVESAFPNVTAR